MRHERVTIVQLARFGDIIQTSPLIQNLKREDGVEREITLAVDHRAAPAARLLYGVDHVIEIDLSHAANLVAEGGIRAFAALKQWVSQWCPHELADRLILLNQGELTSAIATLIPAAKKIGPFLRRPLPKPHQYLNQAIRNRNMAPLHLAEVWAAYGPPILPLLPPLLKPEIPGTGVALHSMEARPDSLKTTRFVVNVGAGGQERMLPAAKLAVLVSRLLENGSTEVVLTGTRADEPVGRELLEKLEDPRLKDHVINVIGQTSISDLPGVLRSADMLISSDTGTLQLAAAIEMKTLGLFFGGANPVETGAYCNEAVALVVQGSTSGTGSDSIDPERVADLAWSIVENTWQNGRHHDSTFTLMVARPTSVGPEYVSASRIETADPAMQRRRAAARRFLWGIGEKEGASGEDRYDSPDGFRTEFSSELTR